MISYSVIIPVYNEERNLENLYVRLTAVLRRLNEPYEIIFVDDSSLDGSLLILKGLAQKDAHIKIISLSRNFGHQSAFSAGLDHANGNAVILMDADLQDPPEFIPSLVGAWKEGFEIVFAVRKRRKENFLKRFCYHIFYRSLALISEVKIPFDSGDFSLLDKKVVLIIRNMPEKKTFIRGLRSWVGFRQKGLEYERAKRLDGKSGYTLKKLLNLALSGYFNFSSVPLKIASFSGILFSITGFLGVIYIIILKLTFNISLTGWTSTIVTILFMSGIQLLTVGIIGEYLSLVFDEVRKRPGYIIREKIGINDK